MLALAKSMTAFASSDRQLKLMGATVDEMQADRDHYAERVARVEGTS